MKALFHDEKYQEALENLERSQKFEPDWELSRFKYDSTLKFLLNMKEMVALKGKLKPRKLNSFLKVYWTIYFFTNYWELIVMLFLKQAEHKF